MCRLGKEGPGSAGQYHAAVRLGSEGLTGNPCACAAPACFDLGNAEQAMAPAAEEFCAVPLEKVVGGPADAFRSFQQAKTVLAARQVVPKAPAKAEQREKSEGHALEELGCERQDGPKGKGQVRREEKGEH